MNVPRGGSKSMGRWVAVTVLAAALIPSALIALYARDMPHLGVVHDDAIYWGMAVSTPAKPQPGRLPALWTVSVPPTTVILKRCAA